MSEKRILLVGGGLFLVLGLVLLPQVLKQAGKGPAVFADRGPTVSQPMGGLQAPAQPPAGSMAQAPEAAETSRPAAADPGRSSLEQANEYLKQENFTAAIPLYQKHLETHQDPDVMTSLAICLRQQGRPAEAMDLLKRSLELQPQGLEAKYYLGLVQQYDMADFDAAIGTFEEILPKMPQEHRRELAENVGYMKRVRDNLRKPLVSATVLPAEWAP